MTSVSELQTELSFGLQIPFSYFFTWMSRDLTLIMIKTKLLIKLHQAHLPHPCNVPFTQCQGPNSGEFCGEEGAPRAGSAHPLGSVPVLLSHSPIVRTPAPPHTPGPREGLDGGQGTLDSRGLI